MKKTKYDYESFVDDALRFGVSYFPLNGSINIKSLQKGIHKYAGKGEVRTYQNNMEELVIIKKGTPCAIHEPASFEIGDHGKTVCGESYVVIQKKNDGRLLVNVKNNGCWKIGLRNPDGTCVYEYPHKHRYALVPMKSRPNNGQRTRKFLEELASLSERYNGVDIFTNSDDDGIHIQLPCETECIIGFDTSPKRLRKVASFLA